MRTASLAVWMVLASGLARVDASEQNRTAPPSAESSGAKSSVVLSENELAEISGGAAIKIDVLTAQNLAATSTNNSITAENVQSGAVTIGPNALNFNGIGNFVVNTGNNNVLQGSISVTVVSGPPP